MSDLRPGAPPLWKAVLYYYSGLLGCSAVLGLIGTEGNPLGMLYGAGVVVVAHFVPFIAPPPGTSVLHVAAVTALVAVTCWVQGKLPPWWRIALVIGALFAWFYAGAMIMGRWT